MKKLLLLLSAVGIIFTACENFGADDSQLSQIEVVGGEESLSLNFPSNGVQTKTVTFKSNYDWSVTVSESWIKVSPESGEAGKECQITVSLDRNDSGETRSGKITISIEGQSIDLAVTQSPQSGEVAIPNNEIWYTSTDGDIVTPYATDAFGANIVSNTYENGKGVIVFDAPVTSIGNGAFALCTSLTSVTIPNSVTSIGVEALALCTSLTNVTIGNSVTSIEEEAFSGCTSLTSVTIPDSVTSIEEEAFSGCTSLTAFHGKFASADNRCLIVDGVLNSFAPAGQTEYTIPDSVTSIGRYAFGWCTSLTSVIIPNSVTSIGDDAFDDCSSLTSVTIGNSVTSIGNYAFRNCTSLASVTIPNSVTLIGYSAFYSCTSLKEAYCKPTTPPTLSKTWFSEGVFDNNAADRKIYVPRNSVSAYKAAEYWKEYADYIEGYNFENGEVAAPQPANNEIWYTSSDGAVVTPYKSDVFGANIVSNTYENGKGIITFDGDVTSIGKRTFYYCTSLTSITIPDSVTEIGSSAFNNCTSLASVTIPNSVTSIGENVFSDCTSLTSVTIPDSVTSIGRYAFGWCTSLTSVTIPDSVNEIEVYTFFSCTSLTSVTISNGVTYIGSAAFGDCTSLTSITIPDSVTFIGSHAFDGCTSLEAFYGKFASEDNRCLVIAGVLYSFIPSGLTEYTIPNSVTSIGYAAFEGCTLLTSVTIPDSVTSIGIWAFNNCTSLTSVYCKPTTPPAGGSDMFYNNASGRKIYVPRNSVSAYKAASYWSNYADYIEGYDF